MRAYKLGVLVIDFDEVGDVATHTGIARTQEGNQ